MQNRREFLMASTALASVGALHDAQGAEPVVPVTSPAFRVGEPVLEAPASDSMGVAWCVNRLSTGFVEVSENTDFAAPRRFISGELPMGMQDAESLTVRLTGLKPDTRYWYRTVTQEVISDHCAGCQRIRAGERFVGRIHTFTTLGPRGASRFAVMNDTHAAFDSFAYTAAALKAGHFPLVVWNGDALNCTDEKRVAVEAFLAPHIPDADYASETPVLWTNGNHDYEGTWARRLEEVMLARPAAERATEFAALKWNFAVRQGAIALIGLDTGEGIHDMDKRLVGMGRFSEYRREQAKWLEKALESPEIAAAPFAVAFCHIPLWNTGENPFGCWEPRGKDCASWIRECYEAWGPILDRAGVQLVVCGHEHAHRWDDAIPRFKWKQVLGGGPELSIPRWGEKGNRYYPTLIEGEAKDGNLIVRVRDTWHNRIVSERRFAPRPRLG